jgi:hypothetical protein
MKKTNKENPLTFFRKANEARQKVVKNSLAKARNGIVAGPQTEMQSILSNAMNSQPAIPRLNRPSRDEIMEAMQASSTSNVDTVNQEMINKALSTRSSGMDAKQKYLDQKAILDQDRQRYGTPKNSDGPYKKGGSVKSKKK